MTQAKVNVDDIVGKLFEVPEMDEETRILYIVGILGGPTSPYQILPAYNPDADLAWFILENMSKAIFDALEKFKDGEYNELQVRAAIYIAQRVLANYLTGYPLDVVNAFGQLTALGAALAVLETGEMILRKIPPSKPVTAEDMKAWKEECERREKEWLKYERARWDAYNAEKRKGDMMRVEQERLMNHSLGDRLRYWAGAAGEVSGEAWNSSAGIVAGVVVATLTAVVLLATAPISIPVILTAISTAALFGVITNAIVGAADSALGGALSRLTESFITKTGIENFKIARKYYIQAGIIAETGLLVYGIANTAAAIAISGRLLPIPGGRGGKWFSWKSGFDWFWDLGKGSLRSIHSHITEAFSVNRWLQKWPTKVFGRWNVKLPNFMRAEWYYHLRLHMHRFDNNVDKKRNIWWW